MTIDEMGERLGSPACAGTDLEGAGRGIRRLGFPRMRGDRPLPLSSRITSARLWFPRMRGDRPFDVTAEAQLTSVPPHARG